MEEGVKMLGGGCGKEGGWTAEDEVGGYGEV